MLGHAESAERAFEPAWTRQLSHLHWLVLLIGLLFSWWVSLQVQSNAKKALVAEYQVRADSALTLLTKRLQLYEQVLRGTGAMLSIGHRAPEAFEDYVRNSQMLQRLPGLTEIGFAEYADAKEVRPSMRVPMLAASQSAPTPGLRLRLVHTDLPTEQRLFGDALIAQVSVQDILRSSAETGSVGLSRYIGDPSSRTPEGKNLFVMVVPVFESGRAVDTPQQRSKYLRGWVLAPIRIQSLVESALAEEDMAGGSVLDIHIHDGEVATPRNLIFGHDVDDEVSEGFFQEKFHGERRFQHYDHTWILQFISRVSLQRQLHASETTIVPGVALLVSVLGSWITWLIVRGRERALQLARQERQLLDESELRFRTLGDAAPVKIRLTDTVSHILWLNRAWQEFLGDQEGSVGGYLQNIHPDDASAFSITIAHHVTAQQRYTHEYRVRDRHGNYRWMLETGVPRRTPEGLFQGYVACSMDVTEQKEQALELLQKSEELERIFEANPDALLIADPRGMVLQVNPQFCRLTGYCESEVVGHGVEMLIPPDLRAGHGAHVAAYMDTPTVRSMAVRRGIHVLCKDGSTISIDIALSPVKRQGATCAIATMRDATERIRSHKVLQEALRVAETTSQAKSDFVANMSHELRTPLNGILGMAELTLQTELNEAQTQYLNMLRTAAKNLLTIVNDVLDFSRIESGQLQLEEAPFDLDQLIGQMGKSLASLAHDKKLQWLCELDPQVPRYLLGDPGRLRQVLLNLVGNAIKFTSDGEVMLHVGWEADVATSSVVLHFAIRDTGIGIAADQLERVFQKFSQADASTTRLYGGTGLGLAISSNLVEKMHGRIWVDSAVGQGSTFHFTAQFKRDHEAPAVLVHPVLQSLPVLVLDPNPGSQRIVRDVLQAQGMVPVVFAQAKAAMQALDAAHLRALALMVVDEAVYGSDEFHRWQQQCRQEGIPPIPVILNTRQLLAPSEVAPGLPPPVALMKPVCRHEWIDCILALINPVRQATENIPADGGRARQPLKILLAEDNEVNSFLATTVLQARGHTVVNAKDGLQAVALAQSVVPDLILMDMQMPHMDGIEATRQIRGWEQQHGGHIRIVSLSANVLEGDKRQSTEAGVDGHLGKPYQQWELIEAVEQERSTASTPPEPLLTSDLLDHLIAQSGGNLELTRSLLEACELDLVDRFESIQQAFSQADSAALYKAVHVARGMVTVFSRGPLSEVLLRLERLSAQGQIQAALAMREELEGAHQRFRKKIHSMQGDLVARQAHSKTT